MVKNKNYSYDILEDINSVASVTECTGLMQIPPTNENEAENYNDIYVIPYQVNNMKRLKDRHKKRKMPKNKR